MFSDKLLQWHNQNGRHDLPWQKRKTPYRVWVSEIMLQQTQVKTVIPYYDKFMKRFPNVKSLAIASQDDVLSHWTGLGYYSRARNLHKAAHIVYKELKSRFPKTPEGLIALPGIGRSTAHAILSIAHDQRYAILDGNVKRVICRHHGIQDDPYERQTENKLWDLAEKMMPEKNAGHYTQAIMDLGATLCVRTRPKCNSCPVQTNCVADKRSLQHLIPKKKRSKLLPTKEASFIIYTNNANKILLEKRIDKGLWGGLWVLPQDDEKECKLFKSFRHTFSHFHLKIKVYISKQCYKSNNLNSNQNWFGQDCLSTIGLPRPIIDTLNAYYKEKAN